MLRDAFPHRCNRRITGPIAILFSLLVVLAPCAASAQALSQSADSSGKTPAGNKTARVANAVKPRPVFDDDKTDQYALQAPPEAEGSIETLAAYLAGAGKTDHEKARAIYRWITASIVYNVVGFVEENYGDVSAEGTLRNRMSVCNGYANLFQRLAQAAGLEAVVVTGYARGANDEIGLPYRDKDKHAWNAVKIDGKWQLLDCTWGAGSSDLEHRRFEPQFDPFWFLTPPDEMIYTHFPNDLSLQLLDRPVAPEDQILMADVEPHYFECGLQLDSHKHCLVTAGENLIVTLRAPTDTLVSARLYQGKRELDRGLTFTQRDQGKVAVYVLFPAAGEYDLQIFAKKRSDPGLAYSAVRYRVRASAQTRGWIGFPTAYTKFSEVDAYLYNPASGNLQAGSRQYFSIRVPGAQDVGIEINGHMLSLTREGATFSGYVTLPPGKINLYARFPGNESYDGLLEFTAR